MELPLYMHRLKRKLEVKGIGVCRQRSMNPMVWRNKRWKIDLQNSQRRRTTVVVFAISHDRHVSTHGLKQNGKRRQYLGFLFLWFLFFFLRTKLSRCLSPPRFNQDGGLRTPRRRGVSEEAEQKLRGDYMSSYFVKLRPLDFNRNQSYSFCLSTILRETWITLIRTVVLLAAR
ncbi:unnamed protein product [Brassica oleracea]